MHSHLQWPPKLLDDPITTFSGGTLEVIFEGYLRPVVEPSVLHLKQDFIIVWTVVIWIGRIRYLGYSLPEVLLMTLDLMYTNTSIKATKRDQSANLCGAVTEIGLVKEFSKIQLVLSDLSNPFPEPRDIILQNIMSWGPPDFLLNTVLIVDVSQTLHEPAWLSLASSLYNNRHSTPFVAHDDEIILHEPPAIYGHDLS
ncbi:hypothetical protein VNO77_07477 [Canavalia gladiata]|uniref:Uncharacterized protein n=1 Tax=Canavalia gladiata TaxID=3824 RepID=A0AAN9MED3_CANGL